MLKLPEPIELSSPYDERAVYGYTEAQLKQFGRDVLEQAAKVCEGMQSGWASDQHLGCAIEIRKMKEEI